MVQIGNINKATPEEIQKLANNHAIAVNLRDAFPYPYAVEDAVVFLELAAKGVLGHVFGIYDNNTFVGCCSLIPKNDVCRINAETGYWIGEPYWGRGYATYAVGQCLKFAFEELGLLRVYAHVFEYNIGSMKVLEKAGFEKEAIIKSSVIKEGRIIDEHLYSIRK